MTYSLIIAVTCILRKIDLHQIVFVARDFVAADSVAVLDEIKVDFVPCPSKL